MLNYKKEKIRLTLLKLLALHTVLSEHNKSKRSIWVRPIYTVEQRRLQGDSDNLIKLLETNALYFNYLRMDINTFEYLLSIVGSEIQKQYFIREPISSRTRLQICIRYLASGDTIRSVGYAFRVSPNTVSYIVEETCNAIWYKLKDIVMPTPNNENWKKIADEFEDIWNFSHCIGATDGKHVAIEVKYFEFF